MVSDRKCSFKVKLVDRGNRIKDLLEINEGLLESAIKSNFTGYDPFDGLNSKLFKPLVFYRSRFLRLAWIQFHKRFPFNLRPLLLIPKKRNAKGIALFILGLLEDYRRTSENHYLEQAIQLGDWLLDQTCDKTKWKHSCWSYHFDWESKAFFVPKTTPNIISTIYVSRALYQLGEICGADRFCDAALDSANFIVNTLLIEKDGNRVFGYIPGEQVLVHNANLWGAAWIAFVANKKNDPELAKISLTAARISAFAQSNDGSWVYGTRGHHQFIDGFHTGYNLEALDIIKRELDVDEFDSVISKGLDYYRNTFFLKDGTCKYYNNNPYPYDMHSVAQALITFLKISRQPSDQLLMKKIIEWALGNMYIDSQNRFRYQKTRWYSNNNDYIRWTKAWCYYAFAFYNARNIEFASDNTMDVT